MVILWKMMVTDDESSCGIEVLETTCHLKSSVFRWGFPKQEKRNNPSIYDLEKIDAVRRHTASS